MAVELRLADFFDSLAVDSRKLDRFYAGGEARAEIVRESGLGAADAALVLGGSIQQINRELSGGTISGAHGTVVDIPILLASKSASAEIPVVHAAHCGHADCRSVFSALVR